MQLRAPAMPLITIDPNFSVWSQSDLLTDTDTVHWTGSPITLSGILSVDDVPFRFLGAIHDEIKAMKQVHSEYDAFTTTYKFVGGGVELTCEFTSAIIPQDLYLLSRPVSYLMLKIRSLDKKEHNVRAKIQVSEEICLDYAGESVVFTKKFNNTIRMGTNKNSVLGKAGDNLRIDWGYFYLTAPQTNCNVYSEKIDNMTYVSAEFDISDKALVTFAYDDIKSIEYFGAHLSSYWNRNGEKIRDEIAKARKDYDSVMVKCKEISDKLFIDAVRSGGEKYADLLMIAFRQAIAAHKIAVDENGEVLFISKECFSNGCAATLDVSYPSIPLFLIYNPELVKGMLRPIVKYARSDAWSFDFAPHDVGTYPKVNGQVYGDNRLEKQMPVEECGNFIIMDAAVAIAENDCSFAISHKDLLDKWVTYLINNGADPENQLCTDDFAGHLAHNCNLSVKAIMGIVSYGIILGMNGDTENRDKYISIAREMAKGWAERAHNGDGSYRLAFDKPDTFSMKYNMVWDKLFGTGIIDRHIIESELMSYKKHMKPFGLPLDNRELYTKSDWLTWTATLASDRDTFEEFIEPMWNAFNFSPSRVPLTDWYWTHTGEHKCYKTGTHIGNGKIIKSFRNRTVQGGLFIKLLEYTGKMKVDF